MHRAKRLDIVAFDFAGLTRDPVKNETVKSETDKP
jgi:hypothetical protein